MKRAIISDVHSNLEGLRAVLADIKGQGISEIYCLGDIIGYGPSPCECIDEVMKWVNMGITEIQIRPLVGKEAQSQPNLYQATYQRAS